MDRELFLNYLEYPGLSEGKHRCFLGVMGTSENPKSMNIKGFRVFPKVKSRSFNVFKMKQNNYTEPLGYSFHTIYHKIAQQ